jgi:hypothetical protein
MYTAYTPINEYYTEIMEFFYWSATAELWNLHRRDQFFMIIVISWGNNMSTENAIT